ncbi:secretoglobin family protein [Mangrovibacter phragmitis]|uniref:secretoglobin family protein n=1 Tax=Mangrovibacter phragmitis TaxID=1691903 RepID=UPI003515BBB6
MITPPLLNHYQAWLDDFTRINLAHGLCQPEIKHWHKLTMTTCRPLNGLASSLVIPHFLLSVTQTPVTDNPTGQTQITKYADYPLLPGILLSECARQGLLSLTKQLKSAFWLNTAFGMRESLTLLCWCELAKDSDASEWCIPCLQPEELQQWICDSQEKHPGLSRLTGAYLHAIKPY